MGAKYRFGREVRMGFVRDRFAAVLVTTAVLGCGQHTPKSTDTAAPTSIAYDDADGDGIIDGHDGLVDADEDGAPNYMDTDSDGDGIPDALEAGDTNFSTLPIDSDQDGLQDFIDRDSDNNCVSDNREFSEGDGPLDSDGDGTYDFSDPDNDGDGISDIHEIGLDCGMPDEDSDGVPNYMDIDSDGDGIGDRFEAGTSEWEDTPRDTDGDGKPDYLDDDSDGDGLLDRYESGVGSPYEEPRDTDGDGAYDFADTDSDGDALPDWDEIFVHGTDAYDADTDGDGYSDGGEVEAGTNPVDPTSVIDGIYVELPERTLVESTLDFDPRIQMGDVVFLLDTTCSMTFTANVLADEFSEIVDSVTEVIPDTEYGFATFDDYHHSSFGVEDDSPFVLRQQVTDNTTLVQSQLSTVDIHNGSDGLASTMEALYQGLLGHGYDQNCDGFFDHQDDVRPFRASDGDVFGGSGGQSYNSLNSGGGTIGGFGFRENALPVIVYASDATAFRDPTMGFATPGGCPRDAGSADVVDAINEIGGYTIAIAPALSGAVSQMEMLAAATGSYADTDGDGEADDPLVFSWSDSSALFRTTVVNAIEDLSRSIRFSRVELEIEGDEWGFVTQVEPAFYDNVDTSEGLDSLSFTLNFRGVVASTLEDQLYTLTLNIMGDEEVLLDTLDIIVVIPGTAL